MKNKYYLHYMLIFLILIIAAMPFAFAQLSKDYDKGAETITLKTGETAIAELKLLENTRYCQTDCHATIEITPLYDVDTKILGKFEKNFYSMDMAEKNMENSWEWYYLVDHQYPIEVDDWGTCIKEVNEYDGKTEKNETKEVEYPCITGSHIIYDTRKTREYKEIGKDILFAGSTYYLEISGKKKAGETIEWIVTFADLELSEWAVWQGSLFQECYNFTLFNNATTQPVENALIEIRNIKTDGSYSVSNFSNETWLGNSTDTFQKVAWNGTFNIFNLTANLTYSNGDVVSLCFGNSTYTGTDYNDILFTLNRTKATDVWDFEELATGTIPTTEAAIGWKYYGVGSFTISPSSYSGKGIQRVSAVGTGYAGRNFTTLSDIKGGISTTFYFNHTGKTDTNDNTYLGIAAKLGSDITTFIRTKPTDMSVNSYDGAAYQDTNYDLPANTWMKVGFYFPNTTSVQIFYNDTNVPKSFIGIADPANFKHFYIGGDRGSGAIDEIKIFSARYYGNETNVTFVVTANWSQEEAPPVPDADGTLNITINWTDTINPNEPMPWRTNSTMNYSLRVYGNTTDYDVSVILWNGSIAYQNYTVENLANDTLFSNITTAQHAGETWNISANSSHAGLAMINSTVVTIIYTNQEIIAKTLTPPSPTLVDDINFTFNVTDIDSDVISVNASFFINDEIVYSYNQSINLGINYSIDLLSGNTSGNDVIIGQADAYDGTTHVLANTSSVTVLPTYLESLLNWTSLPYYTNSTTNYSYKVYGTCGSYNISVELLNGSASFESFVLNDYANDTLFSNTTLAPHAGETWNISINTSCVGAYDANSTVVTILNTAPTIDTAVVINATSATKYTKQINCSFNASDIDSNELTYNYRWYSNNIAINSTSLLTNSSYNKDDVLICEGWANDSSNTNSSLVNSSSLTIGNEAPTIGIPSIAPTTAYTNSTLNCSVIPYDIDFDALTVNFTWYNGSVYYNSSTKATVDGNISSALLPSKVQASGETWNCTTFVNDGTVSSSLTSITKTILNMAPTVSLEAPINRTNTTDSTPDFIFNYTDEDGTAGNCILYVNGTNVGSNAATPSGVNTTITSSVLNDGLQQKWYINCSDGTNTTQSITRVIGIDSTTPIITVDLPTGEYFTQSLPYENIKLNFSYVETSPDSCWYSIDYSIFEDDSEDEWGNNTAARISAPTLAVDENWSTAASAADTELNRAEIYENYTIPSNLNYANWTVKYRRDGGAGFYVYCYNYTSSDWQILIDQPPTGTHINSSLIFPECLNGDTLKMNTSFNKGGGASVAYYYEANVTWFFNSTVTSCQNTTINVSDSGNHTLYLFMNDTSGNEGSSSSNFSISLYNVSHAVSNGNATETEEITFSLMINSTNIITTNATLYYNNTAYGYTTRLNSSHQANFTRVLNIPLINPLSNNISYYWNYSINSFSNLTDKRNLTVHRMGFALCNSTFNTYSLNFSIRNESDSQLLAGDLEGTFYIWYTSAASNRTYLYSGTNSSNYTFCIYPAWASYYTTFGVDYSLSGYPQRSYSQNNYAITNATSNINLYLTPAGEGIYVRFSVVDSLNQPISDVSVQMEKLISGSYQVIETQTSDDSGMATFWVDPDNDYRFTFRKTGYSVYILTLRPTSSAIYYVSLESVTADVVNASIWHGITYTILPSAAILKNNTAYTFSFDISSSTSSLDYYQFDLYNSSNDLLASQSGTTAEGSTLSTSLNVEDNILILGKFYFTVNNTNATIQKVWKIQSAYKGGYSIRVFFEDMENLTVAGMNNFTRLMLAFMFIFGVTAFLSNYAGIYSGKGIVGLIMVLVAITSLVGFMTVESSVFAHIGGRAGYWLAKYSLAMAIELLGLGILFLNPTGET